MKAILQFYPDNYNSSTNPSTAMAVKFDNGGSVNSDDVRGGVWWSMHGMGGPVLSGVRGGVRGGVRSGRKKGRVLVCVVRAGVGDSKPMWMCLCDLPIPDLFS
ncbi:hypothetical protein Drorol1_Dr00025602 [Drosera rotundifolia]